MISRFSRLFCSAVQRAPRNVRQLRFPQDDPHQSLHSRITAYDVRLSRRHFRGVSAEKEILPVLDKLSSLGLSQEQVNHIYKTHPSALTIKKGRNDVFQLESLLQERLGEAYRPEVLRQALFKHPRLLVVPREELDNLLDRLSACLEPSQQDLADVLSTYPKVISRHLKAQLTGSARVYMDYLALSPQEFSALWAKQPYLLTVPPKQILGSLRMLLNKGFTQRQLVEILGESGELASMKYSTLRYTLLILKHFFGLKRKKLISTVMANKRLLVICPSAATLPKIRMFKEFGLDQEYQKSMMLHNPRVFVKSKHSSMNKLKYLQVRHKVEDLKAMEEMPAILNYNYTQVIRPRGEAMLRSGTDLPWKSLLPLSDTAFCQLIGMSLSEFQALKQEMPSSHELDVKKRFFTKTMHSRRWTRY